MYLLGFSPSKGPQQELFQHLTPALFMQESRGKENPEAVLNYVPSNSQKWPLLKPGK